MKEITSDRLKLLPLSNKQLIIWQKKGRIALENSLNLNSNFWETDKFYETETKDALENFWIPYTLLNPERFGWFTNWEIILIEQNISIGGIGFGGYPEAGLSPIGYIIDAKYQNKGFATEAVECILEWAFSYEIVQKITAETPVENLASEKVLLKNGFKKTGQRNFENEQFKLISNWEKNRY